MFPAETTASASPSPTARDGAHERGVRLAAHGLGGLVVHLDHLARDDVLEAVRVELGRAEDDGLDAVRRGGDGACDDLLRGMVAPEGVHGDPAAHATYGAGVPSGWMSRPRYVLQVGQAWCARVGEPQFGHTLTGVTEMPCWARRLSRRAFDVFRLGTAMSGRRVYRNRLRRVPMGVRAFAARQPSASSRVGSIASRKVRSWVTTTSVPS